MGSRRSLQVFPLCLAGLALALGTSAQTPVEPLEGLDPVYLVAGQEVDGDPAITFDRGPFRYSFASAESRDRFAAAPERYEIAQHGFCARMGAPTMGNPQLFHVYQGKIFVFGSGECKRRFVEDPARYLEPKAAPPLLETASQEALAAGKRRLERVVAALGGSSLDAARSLRFTLGPPAPGAKSAGLRWLVFPDQIRFEDERPFGRAVQIVGPEAAALGLASQPPMRFSGPQLDEIQRLYHANPWLLLRARRSSDFVVAEGGPDRLELEFEGDRFVLTLDPTTHRPVSLAHRGRNAEGFWGELVESYSDYRSVGALTLPFVVAVTWNGLPQPGRSFTVATAEADPALPADAFAWPGVATP